MNNITLRLECLKQAAIVVMKGGGRSSDALRIAEDFYRWCTKSQDSVRDEYERQALRERPSTEAPRGEHGENSQ